MCGGESCLGRWERRGKKVNDCELSARTLLARFFYAILSCREVRRPPDRMGPDQMS
jgi:hypothetical protein